MTEVWMPVVGYEKLYEVSNLGRVRNAKGRLLAPDTSQNGYRGVHLYSGGKHTRRRLLVSRVVLEAFEGPAPTGFEAAHGPEGKDVNTLSNLRWATHLDNVRDQVAHGTKLVRRGEAVGKGHTLADIERVRDLRRAGCKQRAIASWIGMANSTVHYILSGATWSHA